MRSRFAVVGFASAILALVTSASFTPPAAAATVLYSAGTIGRWKISDDSLNPSFRCIYKNPDPRDGQLTKIKVWPAKVWGSSTTSQKVGWRFTVTGQADHQGSWVDLYTSPWQFGTATSATRANFVPMAWIPDKALVNGNSFWDFNVVLQIGWYRKTRVGTVGLGLEYYRFVTRWGNEVLPAPCGSTGYYI